MKQGGGKDFVVSNTCKTIIPNSHYFHRTDISDKTFDYWEPEEGSWDGCVIHLEDPREDLIEGQSLKVMASGGTHTTKVIEHKVKTKEIKGKPVIIITSLKTMLHEEGMRRWDALRIDTSKKLTKLIIHQKLKSAAGKITHKPDDQFRHALQYCLKPHSVIIPYAQCLENYFSDNLVLRTQINKLLDYVKASAVLHQFQRKKDEKGRLVATPFDYDYARFVFMHLKDETGCALNKDEEKFMQILHDANVALSINDISTRYEKHGKKWIYNNLENFKSKGLIGEKMEWEERANKEIKKIYPRDLYKFKGLPNSLVLSRLFPVFQSNQQDGFVVLQDFSKLCKSIDKERKTLGLSILFEQNQQNQQQKSIPKRENRFCSNYNPTKQNQTKPLQEQMKELQDYCNKVKRNNINLSYIALVDNFPEYLIKKAIETRNLNKLPNGSYDWR